MVNQRMKGKNATKKELENRLCGASDCNPIAIGFKSDAFPTHARINTDIDKDYILLEGEAGAHHAVEGGGAGGGCRS